MRVIFWLVVGALVPIIGACVFIGLVAWDHWKKESD